MNVKMKPYGNGWCDLSIGVKRTEIPELINALGRLTKPPDHFHGHATFKEAGGVADIDFCLIPDEAQDNMKLDSMG